MPIKHRFLIILVILLVSSVTISVFAHYNDLFPGDLWLAQGIQSFSNDFLTTIMQGISFIFNTLGSLVIIAAIGLLVWWRTGWREAVLILVGGIFSATSSLFKAIIDRPRPSVDLVNVFSQAETTSFPSGHSFFAFIFFGFVAYLTAARLQNKSLRIIILTILAALILLVGISRVYLGAHWPSDVIGGYLTGGVFLTILIWIDKAWIERRSKIPVPSTSEQYSDSV